MGTEATKYVCGGVGKEDWEIHFSIIGHPNGKWPQRNTDEDSEPNVKDFDEPGGLTKKSVGYNHSNTK